MRQLAFPYPRRITVGEVYRDMLANENRRQADQRAIDDRINQVAGNMMRADVAQLVHQELAGRIANLEAAATAASDHAWSTRSTMLVSTVAAGMSSALTVLITLIVQH